MSYIVFGSFGYWCDGHCTKEFVERADSEMNIIIETAERCAYNDEGYRIDEVIGDNPKAITTKIHQVVQYITAEKKRLDEVSNLKRSISINEKWFADLGIETIKRTESLVLCKTRLSEIE